MLAPGEVLGLQRGNRLMPGRAARRSLLRGAADPQQQEQFLSAVYAGEHPPPRTEDSAAASVAPHSPGTGEAVPKSASLCTAASLDGSPTQAAIANGSLEGGAAKASGGAKWAQLAECDSEDALLAEASSFHGSDAVTGRWVSGSVYK